MHGENHRRRGTCASEDLAHRGNLGDIGALPAKVLRNQRAEQSFLTQRGDGLVRKARVAIDLVRRRAGNRRADAPCRVDRAARHGDRRHWPAPISSSRPSRIAVMLAKAPRRSIRSGNSMSKRSSRASMTVTLACELRPAS